MTNNLENIVVEIFEDNIFNISLCYNAGNISDILRPRT